MMKTPFQQIKELLSNRLPPKLISYLPTKWEKIGDILVIKLPNHLEEYKKEICEKYAKTLCCKTVLVDLGISGDYREPKVEKVYGSSLETIHLENGVRFKLDASRIMFSSGNLKERIRMASISSPKETVVDLFAGIGYFTLPIAVHSKPKKIFACEINPIAYNYLCQNIVLNHVTSIVQPLLGDNRSVAPRNIADRVIMGCIRNTQTFLPLAFECLKEDGFIHYHNLCPTDSTDKLYQDISQVANHYGKEAKVLALKRIKSYAPGIDHYVLDVKVI